MFIDEALISVRLRHPNVVRVDELGEQNNVYYLVMEYVHGCSLAQLLRAMGRQGRRMRPEIAVWIAQQVAAGLHAAHEMTGQDGAVLGIIHRDVSPQNVLLSVDGEVKLLDFGIAKARGRAERTEAGVIKGKVRYMSPEQAAGEDIDRRVDIYALGVVLWEMLTMRRYIDGKNEVELIRKVRSPDRIPPSMKAEGIDPLIDEAVMAALAFDIGDRPATAAHLYHSLARAVPEGTIGPPHIAELIRIFVGDEIEAAARALPVSIGEPIAKRVRGATPLPGETPTPEIDDATRVATLTRRAPKDSFQESEESSAKHVTSEEMTRSMVGQRPPDPPVLKPPPPSEPPPEMPELKSFDEGEDEAPMMETSGPIFAAQVHRAEAEARANAAIPSTADHRPLARTVPLPTAGDGAPAPSANAAPPDEPSAGGWILRVALITLIAFGVGAGFAVVWVRFFAH
jgi:serine/threonine protein kinase